MQEMTYQRYNGTTAKKNHFERDLGIFYAVLKGSTLKDVGEYHGITGPRVRQIINRLARNSWWAGKRLEIGVPDLHQSLRSMRENKNEWLELLKIYEQDYAERHNV